MQDHHRPGRMKSQRTTIDNHMASGQAKAKTLFVGAVYKETSLTKEMDRRPKSESEPVSIMVIEALPIMDSEPVPIMDSETEPLKDSDSGAESETEIMTVNET